MLKKFLVKIIDKCLGLLKPNPEEFTLLEDKPDNLIPENFQQCASTNHSDINIRLSFGGKPLDNNFLNKLKKSE